MWLIFAFGSALFAGITSILAKCGIQKTDSAVATAVRTMVVVIFAWLMAFLTGGWPRLGELDAAAWLFLILSGLATGLSWLCYFRALQIGDINKVVPVDKSSTVLTMLLAFLLLGEQITAVKGVGMVLIGAGTYLMIEKKKDTKAEKAGRGWLWYASGSAIFASLTSILGKIGMQGIHSDLGTAIRTTVVLLMAWLMVAVEGKGGEIREISRRELVFICLSGVATGCSWLCYYRALQEGPASVVAPVDKLSLVVTVLFSRIVFHERLSARAGMGLTAVVGGTLLMVV